MATFLEIHSPKPPTQCVPTTFSWDGGEAPYTLKITSVTSSGIGDILQTFSGIGDKSFQWPVNLSGGTQFGIVLSDSTPITVQFEPVQVQAGPDSSCLGGSTISTSISTDSPPSASSTAPPTSAQPTSPPPTDTTSAAPTGTTSASDATSAPSVSLDAPTSSSRSSTGAAGGSTGLPSSPSGSSKSLSSGAVAGIAIGAALLGILLAVLAYWLWKRTRRGRGDRAVDLNESTLTPSQPPMSSKAAMVGQARTSAYSEAPRAPSSPSSASSAHYRSGVSSPSHYPSGVSSPSHYAATSRTQSMVIPASGGASPNARLSAVESIGAGASVSASSARRSSASGLKSGEIRPRSSLLSSAGVAGGSGSGGLRGSQYSHAGSMQERDAGVRLAGGPPPPRIEVTEVTDVDGPDEGAPVPPPYQQYD